MLDRTVYAPAEGLRRGAYVLAEAPGGAPDLVLIGTGSEVQLVVAAQAALAKDGIRARAVSMPSWELFAAESADYRESVLPRAVARRLAVEAGATFGWDRWVGTAGAVVGVDRFGASAPGEVVLKELGFTVEHVGDPGSRPPGPLTRAAPRSAVRRPFVVLWLATLLFYLGFQLLLPVIPLYAARLGAGEAHVGFIIGVFALAAMVPRPIAGDLADRIGADPWSCSAPPSSRWRRSATRPSDVPGLLVLRLFHGTGMGLGPTAATVIATDLTSPERRGAAMGVYGLASAVALAVGPYLGGELVRRLGFTRTFLVATGIEAGALALAWTLPETRPAGGLASAPVGAGGRAVVARGRLARFWHRSFSTAAVYPSGLVLALYVSYGGLAALLPLFAERRQLGNPGLFFTVYALVSLAVRSPAGRLSDRCGRRAVIAPALAISGVSLVLLGLARSQATFLTAAALYGVGFGAGQPALLAMTADRVPPGRAGARWARSTPRGSSASRAARSCWGSARPGSGTRRRGGSPPRSPGRGRSRRSTRAAGRAGKKARGAPVLAAWAGSARGAALAAGGP